MGKKIYISIATYNERENIEKLIRKIFDLKIDDLSVIVVDDNSPDGTSEAVKNLQSEFPSVFLIKRSGKLGYGTAHKAGFKKAMGYGADIIISMDADFSHDPKDIPSLIEQIEKGYDVAIGSRKVKDGGIVGWGLWRRFCSAGATFISKLLLGIKTQDLTNGFRAYKRSIFDEFDLDEVKSGGYSFLEESIYLIEKRGFSVKEIPVIFLNREFGKSKLTRHEIISFFRTIFKLKFNLWKRFVLDKKNIPLILLGASGFIGFWHALPMLDVIGDEMYFTGGVLRAIENHSLLPALGDVPYGTITYLFNYFLIGGFLLVLSIFFKFNFYDLKNYLVQSPELIYIIPRLLSAFLAMVYLWLFNKILKKEVENYKIRIFILILIFTNMLTVSVLHTGKMWVLSTLLVLISFYYLYEALKDGCNLDGDSNNRSIFLSILFSFLAAANFIFFAFSLINIPLFFIFFWRDKTIKIKIFKYVFISLIGFLVIISLNFPSTKQLVIGMLSTNNPILDKAVVRENLKIIASFWLYFKKIIAFFPLHLLAIILILKDKIKNKKLFIISTIYFFTYFIAISAVATWSNNIYAYSRYVLPLGFFLGFIVISFNIKFRKIFYFLSLISIIYFALTIYFISVPTTYNRAHKWIIKNLNYENVAIMNNIRDLELPKNKESYLQYQEVACASKCRNVIDNNLNAGIKYFVMDWHSKRDIEFPLDSKIYYIEYNEETKNNRELIVGFLNKADYFFSLESHMANYFDLDFFCIKNFGPDIYIYENKVE